MASLVKTLDEKQTLAVASVSKFVNEEDGAPSFSQYSRHKSKLSLKESSQSGNDHDTV